MARYIFYSLSRTYVRTYAWMYVELFLNKSQRPPEILGYTQH